MPGYGPGPIRSAGVGSLAMSLDFGNLAVIPLADPRVRGHSNGICVANLMYPLDVDLRAEKLSVS